MAKLKAPLLSLGAAGAIGKSLVFFPWKGLDAVREYVIPSNPKTTKQNTQRGYLTAAVDKVHFCEALAAHPLDQDDQSAYALWASISKTPLTWFNQIIKMWLDCKVTADTPVIYSDGTISDTLRTSIDLIMYINQEAAGELVSGKFYFGTSKTALINSKAATVVANTSVALIASDCSAFLTAGTKYYVQFRPDVADHCEHADSGIYYFTAT